MADLTVVGGGLAGCEAAWQAAKQGIRVKLFEMRPGQTTGAHTGGNLAELVCSNSLGSNLPDRASGLLKDELRRLGSLLIHCADESSLPAGGALAVDRELFSQLVTDAIQSTANIQVIREEYAEVPNEAAIVASGPLTSSRLSQSIQILTGSQNLYFYDAIAPIVMLDSIDMDKAFRASRYGRGYQEEGDYINCPLNRTEYYEFVDALINAERIQLKEFEVKVENGVKAGMDRYFEACLPVEILARRDRQALAFGPMRPIGLVDPHTGERPFAVLQLRQDNLAGTLYNMVGFQTNLNYKEQKRVFRMIPGLEGAEFARLGQMHRNTYIFSPAVLRPTLQYYSRDDLFFAGQITGVEGYAGNIATGLLAGLNAARCLNNLQPVVLPETTMLGALCHYITNASVKDFQPMKANFGILPPLDEQGRGISSKREKAAAYRERSMREIETFVNLINSG